MYQYKRRISKKLINKKAFEECNIQNIFEKIDNETINYNQLYKEFFNYININENHCELIFNVPRLKKLKLSISGSEINGFFNIKINLNINSKLDFKIKKEINKLERKKTRSKNYENQKYKILKLKKRREKRKKYYLDRLAQIIGYSSDQIIIERNDSCSDFLQYLRKYNKNISLNRYDTGDSLVKNFV
ncbi:hypothetical protein [Companilactobacillus sp. DQM5]|uniref:hypothetical protein n=1 Tax=Companilactobacillus sp. DQM5 TaxID=3463359 RepID=UPI00405895D0